jgi:hypothetical protein
MNDADDKKKAPPRDPAANPAPPKKSAMKLPPGVTPVGPRGPQQAKPWETGHSGRPQKDFARRAGKSRKVH